MDRLHLALYSPGVKLVVELLDVDTAILHRLGRVGDLKQRARRGGRTGVRALVDELDADGCRFPTLERYAQTKRIGSGSWTS
jgi:hypothetical protein